MRLVLHVDLWVSSDLCGLYVRLLLVLCWREYLFLYVLAWGK